MTETYEIIPGFVLWRALARTQIAATSMMARRAHAYLAIPQALTNCQTGEDILNSQVKFWQRAQTDYAEFVGDVELALAGVSAEAANAPCEAPARRLANGRVPQYVAGQGPRALTALT